MTRDIHSDISDIFESDNNSIILNEELMSFVIKRFIDNLIQVNDSEIIVFKSSIALYDLIDFLKKDIEDSILKVIIKVFEEEGFKNEFTELLDEYFIKRGYDISIKFFDYEYNEDEIKLIISGIEH